MISQNGLKGELCLKWLLLVHMTTCIMFMQKPNKKPTPGELFVTFQATSHLTVTTLITQVAISQSFTKYQVL